MLGFGVGCTVGLRVGLAVGMVVGFSEGVCDGRRVGLFVGLLVGVSEGNAVGAAVVETSMSPQIINLFRDTVSSETHVILSPALNVAPSGLCVPVKNCVSTAR